MCHRVCRHRISLTGPRGDVTTFAYDADNKMIGKTDPLVGATAYGYDAENNPVPVTDAVYKNRAGKPMGLPVG